MKVCATLLVWVDFSSFLHPPAVSCSTAGVQCFFWDMTNYVLFIYTFFCRDLQCSLVDFMSRDLNKLMSLDAFFTVRPYRLSVSPYPSLSFFVSLLPSLSCSFPLVALPLVADSVYLFLVVP